MLLKNKKIFTYLRYLLYFLVFVFVMVITFTFYSIYIYDDIPATFIPEYNFIGNSNSTSSKLRISEKYIIEYDKKGVVYVSSSEGDYLFKSFLYYSYKNHLKEIVHFNDDISFTYDGISKLGASTDIGFLSIEFSTDSLRNQLEIKTSLDLNKSIELERISVVLIPMSKITALNLKNNVIDSSITGSEYWLGKNGMIEMSTGSRSFILRSRNASSMQYSKELNQLWINGDFNYDHPYYQILKNQNGRMSDRSFNVYSAGDSLSVSFIIYPDQKLEKFPSISNNPGGYLSTIIWTEHADNTIIETHKAVHFGSSIVDSSKYAVGGFSRHNIPITKSVFYSNIRSYDNSYFNDEILSPQLAINNSPDFYHFLKDLMLTEDVEIALHTLEPWDDHILDIDSALTFMQSKFGTVTWIDHGMSDGFGNRESFVSEGLIPGSYHYMSDYWSRYGLKYFWNSSIEKFYNCGNLKQKLKSFSLMKFINCYFDRIIGTRNYLMSGDYEHIPTPLFWQNNFHSEKFYSWGTLRASGHHRGWVWDYKYRESVLNKLVEERGINIIHTYPAFVGRIPGYYNGMWEKEGENYIINPDFDEVLARMAKFRDDGLINLTTIRDYLDFRIGLENVEVQILGEGEYNIINNNHFEMQGVTLMVDDDFIIEIDSPSQSRYFGGDFLCWFDIPSNSSHLLKVLSHPK